MATLIFALKISIMDQLTLGIGTRLQHTQFGPGVIVGVKYAVYLVSFIHHGIKEIDKTDEHLEEIIPENVTEDVETHSDAEKSIFQQGLSASLSVTTGRSESR